MRKLLTALLATTLLLSLAMLLAGCTLFNNETVQGNGEMTDQTFSYDGTISRIVVSDVGLTINVTPEDSRELRYTIDENLSDLLEITFQNGELRITTSGNRSINSEQAVLNVGAGALSELVVDWGANVVGSGIFTADTFSVDVSSISTVNFEVDAQNVSAEASGGASIVLSGTTGDLNIGNSGSSEVNTRSLIAEQATVGSSGASTVYVYATETLTVDASGGSSVTHWGDPEVTSSLSGGATITPGN